MARLNKEDRKYLKECLDAKWMQLVSKKCETSNHMKREEINREIIKVVNLSEKLN